jgi:hypothetical protein
MADQRFPGVCASDATTVIDRGDYPVKIFIIGCSLAIPVRPIPSLVTDIPVIFAGLLPAISAFRGHIWISVASRPTILG